MREVDNEGERGDSAPSSASLVTKKVEVRPAESESAERHVKESRIVAGRELNQSLRLCQVKERGERMSRSSWNLTSRSTAVARISQECTKWAWSTKAGERTST